MNWWTRLAGPLLAGVAILQAPVATAQDYPSRLIRIVVPFPAGDGSDRIARILAERMQAKWNQPVVVENRTGAGGNIGAEAVSKAPPDGYTLMVTPQFTLVINKSLYPKLNFDPNAFAPVSVLVGGDIVLVTNPRVPASNVQELISYAKSKGGAVNYASPGAGSMGHLIGEYFKTREGVNIAHIPYKGGTPALMDLLAGQVDMMFVALGPTVPHVKAGKLRALGVAGEKRSRSLPDVPLMSTMLPDFVFTYWFGMVAPPGTPQAITSKLSATMAEILKQPDVQQKVHDLNLEVVAGTPEQMEAAMVKERERWERIIKATGVTAE
jgi:tripartite-type tricarboxylate transporter receptor subunit TctC